MPGAAQIPLSPWHVFKDFEKRETGYMDEVRDTLECRANKVIREDFLKSQAER